MRKKNRKPSHNARISLGFTSTNSLRMRFISLRCHPERSRRTSPTCVTRSAFVRSLDCARDDIAKLQCRFALCCEFPTNERCRREIAAKAYLLDSISAHQLRNGPSMKAFLTLVLTIFFVQPSQGAVPGTQFTDLQKLSEDFWAWRARTAPFTGDDVNRIERPGGMRDWSRAAMDARERQLEMFEDRYGSLEYDKWPIPKQVDYRLIGSALSRVRYEIEVNARWKRDPNFYLDQTLTALAEALTVPAPYNEAASREILTRIQNIPTILLQGVENLKEPPAPFAAVCVQNLEGVRDRLRKMASALVNSTTLKPDDLNSASDRAADALENFRTKLQERLPTLRQQTALGRDSYVWFLQNIALVPYAPEELLAMGAQEWNRAVAFETYERN